MLLEAKRWPKERAAYGCKLYQTRYILPMKQIAFLGDSLDRISAFPVAARRTVGYQLDRVQRGLRPDDFKPLPRVGKGAEEIRVKDAGGTYRVIYLARTKDIVYVLHAFMKKSRRTSQSDIELARTRMADILRMR